MISKTKMVELVKDLLWNEVAEALRENPALIEVRHERNRNWLHLCCMVDVAKRGKSAARDSIKLAEILLNHFDVNDPAFTEGDWKATPLWHAIAFGKNLPLAACLLKRGSDPDHCLYAAIWNNDSEAIRLLLKNGAPMTVSEGSTPLLGAVSLGRLGPAKELLKLGADPNARDRKGRTPMHHLLRKGFAPEHFRMFIKHGARGDIPDNDGQTVAAILSRKRDPEFRGLAAYFLRSNR